MEQQEVKALLRRYLDEEGAEGLSRRLGVSRQNIWAVLVGKWAAGGKLLRALGLEERVRFVRIPPDPASRRPQPRMKAKDRQAFGRAAQRAQQITNRAIKAGELPNLKAQEIMCVDCKDTRAKVYDHRDYAKPLEVAPVCHRCNIKRGPGIVSEPVPTRGRANGT